MFVVSILVIAWYRDKKRLRKYNENVTESCGKYIVLHILSTIQNVDTVYMLVHNSMMNNVKRKPHTITLTEPLIHGVVENIE